MQTDNVSFLGLWSGESTSEVVAQWEVRFLDANRSCAWRGRLPL